jgi:hypothetical protein
MKVSTWSFSRRVVCALVKLNSLAMSSSTLACSESSTATKRLSISTMAVTVNAANMRNAEVSYLAPEKLKLKSPR